MTRSHPSRSGDSSRSKPPDRFPEPNVPGGYGGPQGYSTYTPNQQPEQQPPSGYGYPQPPPHPYQLPVPQTNPVGGHAGAISRVHGLQPKTGCVNHHTRPSPPAFPHAFPDPRAPDRAHPPSYPFGAPGRPSVPEQLPYPPVQSWSYGASPPYETNFSHTSGSRSQVGPPDYRPLDSPSPNNVVSRNPPSWPSPTPVQSPAQLPYDAGHGYQTYQPPETVRSYGLRVGQRKAVLVGINYATHPDPRFRLRWGVHDAREMARFLRKHFGFERNNIRVLTDDQHDRPWDLPTEANIRAAMSWLVEGAQPGDSLFFYFSGHATQAKDTNRDERDGRDECMCAMDYMGSAQFPISPTTPGIIVDDDINSIMVQPLQQGCRLTAVLDCCHSGTLLDLPFIYDSHGGLKSLDNLSIVEQKSSSADVISLSACKDSENAYEVLAEGGALRKAFIEYMTNSGSNGSCFDVIRGLLIASAYMCENGVKNGVRQRPQLSSSHPININQRFTII
ncbi:caspase domain-containing protein [Lactarius hatsudake]|nr:caspase domain-containing protein [Lactarius hatsudake]